MWPTPMAVDTNTADYQLLNLANVWTVYKHFWNSTYPIISCYAYFQSGFVKLNS